MSTYTQTSTDIRYRSSSAYTSYDTNYGGHSTTGPYSSTPSNRVHYNTSNTLHDIRHDSKNNKKNNGKSLALQIMNKNALLWFGFLTLSTFIFCFLAGGEFSFLMTYGSMARVFGLGMLNVKIFTNHSATGISIKTLQLYSAVFFFRLASIVRHDAYLPYDKSGDWLYHVLEIMSLIFSITALWACMKPFQRSYQAKIDCFGEMNGTGQQQKPRFGAVWLAVPVFILALFIHPHMTDFLGDVSWAYAMYLESVALIPQLYMFRKDTSKSVDLLTSHFVAALGFGRLMEFGFWMFSYHELATATGSTLPGWLAILSQFLQLVFMCDFFWYYYIAVKNATPLVLPSQADGGMSLV